MKAMISQPMSGRSEKEILETRNSLVKVLESKGYEVINTLFDYCEEDCKNQGISQVPLYYLSKSLESMSHCDAVIFALGWKGARGCYIEHSAALAYGLTVLYEEDDEKIAEQTRIDSVDSFFED